MKFVKAALMAVLLAAPAACAAEPAFAQTQTQCLTVEDVLEQTGNRSWITIQSTREAAPAVTVELVSVDQPTRDNQVVTPVVFIDGCLVTDMPSGPIDQLMAFATSVGLQVSLPD